MTTAYLVSTRESDSEVKVDRFGKVKEATSFLHWAVGGTFSVIRRHMLSNYGPREFLITKR